MSPAASSVRGEAAAPALVVEDLVFRYPDGSPALRGFDLEVGEGERVALLGPNGAGKTTLALHLAGILRAERGSLRVAGLPLGDETLREIRRRVGLVFQDPDDQLFMPTVREDVAFGPQNLGRRGHELEEAVSAALAAVGCGELADRAPHHLSGGERRRVTLATVLAMDPDLLVLDEPTAGLDPSGRRELHDVLQRLHVTQLVITHDLSFALELCPRAVIVNAGRAVADGATVDVLSDGALLAANRLELPFGMDPQIVRRR